MANGTNRSEASNRVVDLLSYKREQHQRRLNFDQTTPPRTPSLAPVTPFRPLTAKAVTHRQRMLGHLSRFS
jgi:hypothetical protein